MKEIAAYLDFIKELEGLKSVTRTAWTGTGRQESTAEHSYRLAMLAMVLGEEFPELDLGKVIRMCLVHDLGERYEGDISAALLPDPEAKQRMEAEGVHRLLAPLPEKQRQSLLSLWEEYEACETKEARLVKALDKAETIIQHNQGKNPPDFDYAFNLEYGKGLFAEHPVLQEIRRLIDADTRKRMGKERKEAIDSPVTQC